ncbi:hypothetical protein B296_00015095 [Ensete ventricosum]|uniref:Uncharacterized protein n=1 Tax=Ensete ventricosum TaxID=4639 RepID=A0A426XQ14_ENSVE|nr:hypothetical protein B296_00015095 [Ensete ventricosum]
MEAVATDEDREAEVGEAEGKCKGELDLHMIDTMGGGAGEDEVRGLLPTTCRQPTDRGTVRKGYRLQGRAAANRGSACRGGRPLARRLPAGKGSRHLRRGDNDDTVRVREED